MIFHAHRNQSGLAQSFKALCLSCLVGTSLLALAVPAAAQSDATNARLDRLENELNTLNRAVYKGETPPAGVVAGAAASENTEVRFQQLESQMRDLTGRMEQQGYDIEQMKTQVERMREVMQQQPPAATTPPQPMIEPYPQSPAPQTFEMPAQAPAAEQPVNEDPNPTMGIKTSTPAMSNDPAAQYEQSFAYLKAGDYGAAEQGFQSFLDNNPGHALSANAIYWLGESFYVRGQYDKASKVFAEAYQKYPGGPKGADNLLKLGMSLGGAGKKKDACIALAQLSKEYPNGPAPILRRAEQEMATLDCR